MSATGIVIEDVSKFYGEVLGVNRIDLEVAPGITGLVGANGAGKSTLLNLIAGLLRPDRGSIRVLGQTAANPEAFYPRIGYCPQVDGFPPGLTGRGLLTAFLKVHGFRIAEASALADAALERLQLGGIADRRIAAYSKGMRQRIKLAWAICHEPTVLILDEPLNGLDPEARVEAMALFRALADGGAHVLVSTHILHELDDAADRVVFLDSGYLAAAGRVAGIRDELGGRAVAAAPAPSPSGERQRAGRPAVREANCGRAGQGALAAPDGGFSRDGKAAGRGDEMAGERAPEAPSGQAMQVRIRCADAAKLAARLFERHLARSIALDEDRGGLRVATDDADALFLAFNDLVLAEGLAVQAVAPADESVQSVFEDLIEQGRGP
jgi:ABC-2 type transport system ATP-binding protein